MSLFINRVVQGKNRFEFAGEVSALNIGAKIYCCSRYYYRRFTNVFRSWSSARYMLCCAAKGGGKRCVWPEGTGRRRHGVLPKSSTGAGASGWSVKAMNVLGFFPS